jgi:hypothetical protein
MADPDSSPPPFDPFGNILGVMYNQHYLEIFGSQAGVRRKRLFREHYRRLAGVPSIGRTKHGSMPSRSVYLWAAVTSSAKKLTVLSPRNIGVLPSVSDRDHPPA